MMGPGGQGEGSRESDSVLSNKMWHSLLPTSNMRRVAGSAHCPVSGKGGLVRLPDKMQCFRLLLETLPRTGTNPSKCSMR